MTIGERIKNRRTELNLTQTMLAHKVGYSSKAAIARIEIGSNQLRQNKIMDFADALDTTPGYIMGWEDEKVAKFSRIFSKLSEEKQSEVIDYIKFIKERSDCDG